MSSLRTIGLVGLFAASLGLVDPFSCLATESYYSQQVSEELRRRAVATLRETLGRESRWAKVHAAEFLLAIDRAMPVDSPVTTAVLLSSRVVIAHAPVASPEDSAQEQSPTVKGQRRPKTRIRECHNH